jgi:cell wall-associated NlpC family hydrolase
MHFARWTSRRKMAQAITAVLLVHAFWLHQAHATPNTASTAGAETPQSAATNARPSPQAILEGAEIPTVTPTRSTAEDPVLRLLADKGLLPSTSPVSQLAGQVKDRASDVAAGLVISAMEFLGVPYRRGGDSESEGFDCSGFTRHVFENSLGLLLPRRAVEQAHAPNLMPVAREDLKPGDLVFFNTLRRTFSHVGIYIGDHKFIHSPRAGGKVRVEDMRVTYWQQRYDGARRAPLTGIHNAESRTLTP